MKFGWSFMEPAQGSERALLNTDEIAKSFARCFRSCDGQRVLNFLASQTKERVLGADATSNELWFCVGQRALFSQIEHLISKGKKGE